MTEKNDDLDFGSLLDDDKGFDDFDLKDNDLFEFNGPVEKTSGKPEFSADTISGYHDEHDDEKTDPSGKKRTSIDFAPDMDALLITAQSPMIIEGMKYMTMRDYSSKRHHIFYEAVKGIDLYIKILQRNPKNYRKLATIINNDIDCREVEKIAFNLYKTKFNEIPGSDELKLKAFEVLREKLKNAYDKTLISSSMVNIKRYFLMTGDVDTDVVAQSYKDNAAEFKSEIARLNHNIKIAMALLKNKDNEIAKGMKGKDVNIFIIKTSHILGYYYQISGNKEASEYYRRINEIYKKYFVVRE